jgi:hypothetical protein
MGLKHNKHDLVILINTRISHTGENAIISCECLVHDDAYVCDLQMLNAS